MADFDKKYNASQSEEKWKQYWEDEKIFRWESSGGESYAIDTPPPTVSGALHMGHVYSYTQADIIARYQRMKGLNVLYPIGFDDNGLPTERLVEKTRKIQGSRLPREEFIQICMEVVASHEEDFRSFFRRLALSVDWQREYQTISEESRKISQMSFMDLYNKDLLRRTLEPTLWDPVDQTALAQAEIEDKEKDGMLHYIPFQLQDSEESVVIATTRPELLGACTSLIISPEDERAKTLVGKTAVSPLYQVPVPIIADDKADPEKGSGVVMCCTFGDTTDIEWWKQHKLPLRVILNQYGKLTDMPELGSEDWPSLDIDSAREVVSALQGMKAARARETIVEMLKERGLVLKSEPVQQVVPSAERSGAPLEINVTPQWFIRTLDFKDELLARGREIDWQPAFMRSRYEAWVENLKWDWCISRQRHFGVPIPVWYSKRLGEEGKVILPHVDDLPVDPTTDLPRGYSAEEVEGEKDVMDTWATSSVSPQLVTRGITEEYSLDYENHQRLFPMALRPQAHEIIRTWAFYTIVKAHHHRNTIPWKTMAISGWCLAEDRAKMSKSKGNVIDPIRLMDQYGTDAIRYWTGTSRLGHDTALAEKVLQQGRRLVTKLWNASKLAYSGFSESVVKPTTAKADIESGAISNEIDLWLLGRLADTVEQATAGFENYEYSTALRLVDDFFWKAFCDNYLEIVKPRLFIEDNNDPAKQSAQLTLHHASATVLRLFAPFMPYLTEELFHIMFPDTAAEQRSIHARGGWPNRDELPDSDLMRSQGDHFVRLLAAARKVKTLRNLSLRVPVEAILVAPANAEPLTDLESLIGNTVGDLCAVMKADTLQIGGIDSEAAQETTEDGSFVVALAFKPEETQ